MEKARNSKKTVCYRKTHKQQQQRNKTKTFWTPPFTSYIFLYYLSAVRTPSTFYYSTVWQTLQLLRDDVHEMFHIDKYNVFFFFLIRKMRTSVGWFLPREPVSLEYVFMRRIVVSLNWGNRWNQITSQKR